MLEWLVDTCRRIGHLSQVKPHLPNVDGTARFSNVETIGLNTRPNEYISNVSKLQYEPPHSLNRTSIDWHATLQRRVMTDGHALPQSAARATGPFTLLLNCVISYAASTLVGSVMDTREEKTGRAATWINTILPIGQQKEKPESDRLE